MDDSRAAPPPLKRIRNLTDERIGIRARADASKPAIVLPPFGEVVVVEDIYRTLALDEWRARRLVETGDVGPNGEPRATEAALGVLVGLTVWGVGILGVWELVAMLLGARLEGPSAFWWTTVLGIFIVGTVGMSLSAVGGMKRFRAYRNAVSHYLTQFAALAVAFGLPLALIQAAGGITPVDAWGYRWLGVGAVIPAVVQGLGQTGAEHVLGRALQLLFIGTVSALPALLFFLFDRRKVDTVRDTFFRALLRIDPTLDSIAEVESVYGDQADEVLGSGSRSQPVHGAAQDRGAGTDGPEALGDAGGGPDGRGGDTSRLLRSHRAIILVATLLITVGWILTLSPLGPAPEGEGLVRYFAPATQPWILAFLGAYTFAVATLIRRYVRSDLKPKAYAQISMRLVTVVILVWVMEAVFTPEQWGIGALGALAFLAGWTPETGFAAIHGLVSGNPFLQKRVPAWSERYPLDLLDGMNLYHRSRLLDEGIENLENLAHAELPDLLLSTRIPLPTLLDWLDQAVLYLHLSPSGADDESGTWDRRALEKDIATLRRYGIRTATDLEAAYARALERDSGPGNEGRREGPEVRGVLSLLGPEEGDPKRLSVAFDAIHDDEWMIVLRQSRRLATTPGRPLHTDPDGLRRPDRELSALTGPTRPPSRAAGA